MYVSNSCGLSQVTWTFPDPPSLLPPLGFLMILSKANADCSIMFCWLGIICSAIVLWKCATCRQSSTTYMCDFLTDPTLSMPERRAIQLHCYQTTEFVCNQACLLYLDNRWKHFQIWTKKWLVSWVLRNLEKFGKIDWEILLSTRKMKCDITMT